MYTYQSQFPDSSHPLPRYTYICPLWLSPWASLMIQRVRNPPAILEIQEMDIQSLGWEDPLEEEMATHLSTLAWKILWTEQPGKLESKGSILTKQAGICTFALHLYHFSRFHIYVLIYDTCFSLSNLLHYDSL